MDEKATKKWYDGIERIGDHPKYKSMVTKLRNEKAFFASYTKDNNSKLHLVESEKRLMETQIQAQKNIITSLEIEVAVLKKADARQAQQLNSG